MKKRKISVPNMLLFLSGLLSMVLFANKYSGFDLDTRGQADSGLLTWVDYRNSGFESGFFGDFDQINAADGTLTIINNGVEAPVLADGGSKVAKAYQYGSNSTDGHFSRTIWNLPDWTDPIFRTEAMFYLPTGFYSSMMGAVQLIGWDNNPVLGNQMRLAIYNSDRKARLFIQEDYKGRVITDNFSIPEGQWVKLVIEQKVSATVGWSKVYMNEALVAQGSANYCVGEAVGCGDTATNYPITRLRYGLVAIADVAQSKPLTVYFDNVKLQVGTEAVTTSPSPNPTINPTPTPTPPPTTTPVNSTPVIETTNLKTGRAGKGYSTQIKGNDIDLKDVLIMNVSNVPAGFSLNSCQTGVNSRTNKLEITCNLSGKTNVPISTLITIALKDSVGATVNKDFRLVIN